jgi:hypothetical protein
MGLVGASAIAWCGGSGTLFSESGSTAGNHKANGAVTNAAVAPTFQSALRNAGRAVRCQQKYNHTPANKQVECNRYVARNASIAA